MSAFRVTHPIAHIRQPSANDRWAAATAMALGRTSGEHSTVTRVKQIAARAGASIGANGSLPKENISNTRKLARALGMTCYDVRLPVVTTFTLQLMKQHLRRGRVAMLGQFDYISTTLFHAIAIYRLYGDGTPTGTFVSFVDPFDGRARNFDWEFFEADIVANPHFLISA